VYFSPIDSELVDEIIVDGEFSHVVDDCAAPGTSITHGQDPHQHQFAPYTICDGVYGSFTQAEAQNSRQAAEEQKFMSSVETMLGHIHNYAAVDVAGSAERRNELLGKLRHFIDVNCQPAMATSVQINKLQDSTASPVYQPLPASEVASIPALRTLRPRRATSQRVKREKGLDPDSIDVEVVTVDNLV